LDLIGECKYDDLSDLIAKRTADLKCFSDHYFGENVALHTVLSGDTADQIESFAKREKVDLIMLPRGHHNILSRIQHDSLTATLLDRSSASVWTTEHVEALDPSSVNSILCAVHFELDVTLDCENYRILQVVLDLATTFCAKVMFLRVIDRQEQASTKASAEQRILAGPEPWLAQMRRDCGNSAEYVSKSGNVIAVISDTANEVDADLIVVGRTRPGTIGWGVQGNILKIGNTAGHPVLSVW
jgi:nucleotide-binding universal stress UspA family protein